MNRDSWFYVLTISPVMKVDKVALSLVSDGQIRLDDGSMCGVVPKTLWRRFATPDRKNRVTIGLNCFLIRTRGKNILLDTGVGTKHPLRRRRLFAMDGGRLLAELKEHGVGPQDIHRVALTHLHFDHAGGCTVSGAGGTSVPTFPRATYLVQRRDWEEATNTNERTRPAYLPEDFLPLEQHGQLQLIDGDVEVAPGVWLRRTGGHTAGHQILFIESEGERAACLGDVFPTHHHLHPHYISAYDSYPMDTVDSKRRLLAQAEAESWLLYFGHGVAEKAGYLERRNGRLSLTGVPPS